VFHKAIKKKLKKKSLFPMESTRQHWTTLLYQAGHAQARITTTRIRNKRLQIIEKANCLVYMCFVMMLFVFTQPQYLTPSLHWDCNYSSNATRVKNQFEENLKMSKIVKEAIKRTGMT